MKGDFSRLTFNKEKGYTQVLQQQGRVTLDADWNEQVNIQTDLDRKRLHDVIGNCGVPYGDAGFSIDTSDMGSEYNVAILAGTIYVGGHRITLNEKTRYSSQPFLQPPPVLSAPEVERVDLVYLCVRERHVTYLEDELIREVALGGPDTTTRVQTIWHLRINEDVDLTRCEESGETEMFEAGVGAGLLTTIDDGASTLEENPCVTPVDSSYRGLENRLYRVEVHKAGTVEDGASIKWSRYNGAVAFKVREVNVSNRILTLARLGWDQIVTLSHNSWVELVSEEDELAGRPGEMLQISSDAGAVNDAQRQVTLKNVTGISDILNRYTAAENVKVRLWNVEDISISEAFDRGTNTTEIVLEDGIRVSIFVENEEDIFRTGDYWTFAARTITGEIDELINAPPQGQEWHCCKLALIHWSGETPTVSDCRPLFPALTEMLQLHYAGGDGQEALPGATLPGKLMVRVSRGQHPVDNVSVVFEVQSEGGGGKVFTDVDPTGGDIITVITDDDGQAVCQWQLGSNRSRHHQRVLAFIDAPDNARTHQRVNFYANLSIAEQVSYRPPSGCINIDGSMNTVHSALNALCSITTDGVSYTPPTDCPNLAGTKNVTEALNALCHLTGDDDPGFHIVDGFWGDDKEKKLIHDQRISLDEFLKGLAIVCGAEPDPESIKQASVFMTLELPDKDLPGIQSSYILEGEVAASDNVIFWSPTLASSEFLAKEIGAIIRGGGVFLARFFLKGSKIWQLDNPEIHLDGNVVSSLKQPNNLVLPSGDGEKGGTFEVWFNVEIDIEGFFVVGVLHPTTYLGLRRIDDNTPPVNTVDTTAKNLRLKALDIGYHHRQVIRNAQIEGYNVSGVLFNELEARLALDESDFVLGAGFQVNVIADEKYQLTKLPDLIVADWSNTFRSVEVVFSLTYQSAKDIMETLRKSLENEKPPSIIICDQSLLDIIRRDELIGDEADGLIRSPFFRRV